MKLHQLSLFIENRPGQLLMPCKVLAEAGINIVTLSLADTQQFGILRLIVEDWEKAKRALIDAGCVVKITDVVAIEVDDRPGGLAGVLEAIEQANLNVEYMYAFTIKHADRAVLVFRFEDADEAIEKLSKARLNLVGAVDIFKQYKA